MAEDKYSVVEFEDGMLVVPEKWILQESKECFYPPYSSKRIDYAVQNREEPLPTWRKYAYKRIFGTSNDYNKCNRRLEKAKYKSDGLSTTDGESSNKTPSYSVMAFPEPPSPTIFEPAVNISTPSSSRCPSAKNSDFEKKVLSKMNYLRIRLDNMQDTLCRIVEILGEKRSNQVNEPEASPSDLHHIDLPVTTIVEFDTVEENLKSSDVKNSLINDLKKVGGSGLADLCRRLLNHVMTNEVGSNFSYMGIKGKRSFACTNIFGVIKDIVRMTYKNATDVEISKPVSSWLSHAKERSERKIVKSNDVL